MAFKTEAQNSIERHDEEETASVSGNPDTVDALVTDFLAQLESIASEAKPAPQPTGSERLHIDNSAIPESRLARQTPIPITQEAAPADAKIELEEINRQIEATLDELERLNPGPISQHDPVLTPQHPTQPAADSTRSVAHSPARQAVPKSAPHPIRKAEEQEWKSIDLFRTEVVSSRSSKRRRNIFIAVVAAAMVLILLYFYIFREI
jgi:hypothetical protein